MITNQERSFMTYNDLPQLRATTIKTYIEHSPMTAKYILDKNEDKPEYAIGRLCHSWLETGTKDLDGYELCPYDSYRSKDARIWRDDVIAGGKIPLTQDDYINLQGMVDGILGQTPDHIERLIREGIKEEVFVYGDYKAQLDISHPDGDIDWKTCAQIARCEIDARRFHHFVQAYHYKMCKYQTDDIDKMLEVPFYFGYISKKAPYETLYFVMTRDAYEIGRQDWQEGVDRIRKAEEFGVYANTHNNSVVPFSVTFHDNDDYALEVTE